MSRIRQIVGLDLGARNVRAAWVQVRGREPLLTRCEQMALPPEGGDQTALIRSWLERLGLRDSFVAVALPGAQVVFQPGRLTPEDPRTPRQAADMELATFNDMAGDSMTADMTTHEWSPGLRVYLMAMARPAVVAGALQALEPLGVRPADLVPAPVALFNTLGRTVAADEPPVLFLDVGHGQTEVAIGTAKGLLFARSVPTGGRAFTEAVAQHAGMPFAQAETRKQREGSLRTGTPLAEALMPVAERWHAQIRSCLSAYRGVFGGDPFAVGRIVLSGGGAQLDGLPEFLAGRGRLPVAVSGSLPGAAGTWQSGAGGFDVAAGLALTALDLGISRLSLLPPRLRDEVVFREKKPYWIAAAVTGALTLSVFTAGTVLSLRRQARELEAERSELRRREKIDKTIAETQARRQARHARCEPLMKLLRGGPATREVIALVAGAISTNDWISLICDETSYLPPKPAAAAAPAQPRAGFFVPGFRAAAEVRAAAAPPPLSPPAPPISPFNVFIVEGYTPDISLASVKAMMRALLESPRVAKVDLLSDDRVLPPILPEELAGLELVIPDVRRFVIRLEMKRR